MVVLHGLLGSKVNWRTLCKKPQIADYRRCYLVEMRNHTDSDHHEDHDYMVMSDDVLRFADQQGLDKFTILGHSMGARTAMTLAGRFPDRVEGCVSVDAAPVNEADPQAFGSFALKVVGILHSIL